MNDKLTMVLKKRYEAEIEDAKYKIKCYSDQELIIPEHPDITGEVDKLLAVISSVEDKLAVMELHYYQNKADKTVLYDSVTDLTKIFFSSGNKVSKCTFNCFTA